jgi:hypothetical protein
VVRGGVKAGNRFRSGRRNPAFPAGRAPDRLGTPKGRHPGQGHHTTTWPAIS